MVQLVDEGRLGQPAQNGVIDAAPIPVRQRQTAPASFSRRPLALALFCDRIRQQPQHLIGNGSGQEVIALEVEVNVLEEKFVSRDSVRTFPPQRRLGVRQINTALDVSDSGFFDDLVEPRIGTKRQRVETQGQFKMAS